MNNRIPQFWKSCSSKFHQNATKDVNINGSNSELVVSNVLPTISVLLILLRTTTSNLNAISKHSVPRSQMISLIRLT